MTHAYFHLYKPGSPPIVTKDLGKSTSQPRLCDKENTHHIHRVAAEIILQMSSQIIVQVWVSKPISENNIALNDYINIVPNTLLAYVTSSDKSI